jgi:hypothetical protein
MWTLLFACEDSGCALANDQTHLSPAQREIAVWMSLGVQVVPMHAADCD